MKDTGIARRVDQLGRIVLPMEIRKKYKIVEGTLLNMYCEENVIKLEKYSPLLNFVEYVQDIMQVCDDLSFLICDDTTIVLTSKNLKQFNGKVIDTKSLKIFNEITKEKIILSEEIDLSYNYYLLLNICKDGDKFGFIVFCFNEVPSNEIVGQCKFVCKYISSKL